MNPSWLASVPLRHLPRFSLLVEAAGMRSDVHGATKRAKALIAESGATPHRVHPTTRGVRETCDMRTTLADHGRDAGDS